MPRQRLIELLDEVHRELEADRDHGRLDAETAERLREVEAEIRQWLDDDADTRDPETFSGPVRRAMARFEAEHPTLAGVVNQVADTLSKMGI